MTNILMGNKRSTTAVCSCVLLRKTAFLSTPRYERALKMSVVSGGGLVACYTYSL